MPQILGEEITFPSGFRISADRSPNRKGMNDICEIIELDLDSEISSKAINGLYILDDGVRGGDNRPVILKVNLSGLPVKKVFFCQKYLWVLYLKKFMKKLTNTLKKLLNINPYLAERNPKKFTFIAKEYHNPLTFPKYDT